MSDMVSGEPDFTGRVKAYVDLRWILGIDLTTPSTPGTLPISLFGDVLCDHRKILGVALKEPLIAQSLPVSWEGPFLAYDACIDAFKVRVVQFDPASIAVTIADDWTRQLGQIDLARVLGAALSHANPVISRLTDGADFIDPRQIYGDLDRLKQRATSLELKTWSYGREWTITENLNRSWNLGSSDVPDLSSRAARELGIVYGSLDKLQQRTTTKDLFVQIRHEGTEKDPTAIRALTTSDKVTPEQATRTSLKIQPEREDLVSLGGVASPNAAGAQILAPSGSLKPKVYDCEYEVLAAGLHYFYFGTTTTATTKRFLTRSTVGVNSKSFVQPRVGAAGDGIYLYSAVSETNMPYDLGYALE